jgi:hypothetical protein
MPKQSAARKPAEREPERRLHPRHRVDTRARLVLIRPAIVLPGRILDLSLGGCRICTESPFSLGIFVRVEVDFYLHGQAFRISGVSQTIQEKNLVGIRFLDMSQRKREQLIALMGEIAEARFRENGWDAGGTGLEATNRRT